ncbi:MAG: hypothetical protein HLUCCA12_13190 [Rhodobacteraceae bacterium HLUCCA12]|nr:MAG: hypothetical protein HLUCCA12_13190 [Rhodobacteraceae bacterium HLUCCA12]
MSRPPREGARWGDDPSPERAPQPQHPPKYIELIQQYGEPNVQKAIRLQSHIGHNYPYLKILEVDALDFASDVLSFAKAQMASAAQDGRPHTMPETLKLLENHIGGALARTPDQTRIPKDFSLRYGDEEKGNAAIKFHNEAIRKANRKENTKSWVGVALFVFGPSAFFGSIAYIQDGGFTFIEAFGIWTALLSVYLGFNILLAYLKQ